MIRFIAQYPTVSLTPHFTCSQSRWVRSPITHSPRGDAECTGAHFQRAALWAPRRTRSGDSLCLCEHLLLISNYAHSEISESRGMLKPNLSPYSQLALKNDCPCLHVQQQCDTVSCHSGLPAMVKGTDSGLTPPESEPSSDAYQRHALGRVTQTLCVFFASLVKGEGE